MAKVKIQNGTIFSAKEPLAGLLKEAFPVAVSVGLITLGKAVGGPYQIIEEARMGIIRKYGDTAPNGGIEVVAPNDPDKRPMSKNWPQFVAEINELFAAETEIDFEKVKIPRQVTVRCDKCKHVIKKDLEIEGNTLIALDAFVEVET